jgi:alpha-tubulin suppressor-like RCC1 family protein
MNHFLGVDCGFGWSFVSGRIPGMWFFLVIAGSGVDSARANVNIDKTNFIGSLKQSLPPHFPPLMFFIPQVDLLRSLLVPVTAVCMVAIVPVGGETVAWGDDLFGQVTPVPAFDFLKIESGLYHNLGIKLGGTVEAWGGPNGAGQNTIPEGLSGVVDVAAGGDFWFADTAFSLAAKTDGSVVGWGNNERGQLTLPPGLANVVSVAAGRSHSLALKNNGEVIAWGANHYGQSTVPAGLANVVAIAAGGFQSLALKSDGSVVAWGKFFDGVAWVDTVVPAGLSDVVAISAGRLHCLALKSDGTVVGWGYDSNGQATPPGNLTGVIGVEAGGFHSFALKSDGTVVAWGADSSGQTTIPVPAPTEVGSIAAGFVRNHAVKQPASFPAITSARVVSAAAGASFVHQITVANGTPTLFSALGLPPELSLSSTTGEITNISATLPMRRSIRVMVDTAQGRLTQDLWINVTQGVAPTAISLAPAAVTENALPGPVGSLTATDADSGDTHVFTLVSGTGSQDNYRFSISGTQLNIASKIDRDFETAPGPFSIRVRAQDSAFNSYEAELGISLLNDDQEDTDLDGLTEAQELTAGTNPALYDSDADGFGDGFEQARGTLPNNLSSVPSGQILVTWGGNDKGQRSLPVGLGEIIDLAAGWGHNLALQTDGTVVAWGWNDDGQTTVPPLLGSAVAVDAGDRHSLALKADGTVAAWGGDAYGQATVSGTLSNVVAIAAGSYHNLALKGDGSVVAWGRDDYGQSSVPVGLSDVVAIAAGGYHSLALKSDGSVVAWGWSGATAVPGGVEGIVSIVAGGFHSVARKFDGSVFAWGDAEDGQVNVPRNLIGTAVQAGWLHSSALKSDRTLAPWGSNSKGQTTIPLEARNIEILAAGDVHNVALRQASGFPKIVAAGSVIGWPGQSVSHPIAVTGATPSLTGAYSAMGLPGGLTINPDTGLISGTVLASGVRQTARITVATDKGRLTQMLWLNTRDGRPPTWISLTPSSMPENQVPGTVIGLLDASDPDAADTHTFNAVLVSGSYNPYDVVVSGNQLLIGPQAKFDFEDPLGGVNVRVRATDLGGNFYERQINVQVTDVRTEDFDGDGMSEEREEDLFLTSDLVYNNFQTIDTDQDGIPSLVEFAFNLNVQGADPVLYLGGPGSMVGLPLVTSVVAPEGRVTLQMEFLRRKNAGLTYTPQFSSGLNSTEWSDATPRIQVIETLGADWERCKVMDEELIPSPATRFGRVRVR